jgi:hypothetical protein
VSPEVVFLLVFGYSLAAFFGGIIVGKGGL